MEVEKQVVEERCYLAFKKLAKLKDVIAISNLQSLTH